ELRDCLSALLPEWSVPSVFVPVPALPLTGNGKLDREALKRVAAGSDPLQAEVRVEPRTPLEASLVAIWREVLNVDSIGVEENYFRFGGPPFLAGGLAARIGDGTGLAVPFREIFEERTVAGLARLIEERSAVVPAGAIEPVDRAGRDLPLSFPQQRLWM